MANERYREYIRKTGFKQWRIAEILGVSEGYLCRMLRNECPEYVIDGLINIVKSEIMQTPYDVEFFVKYKKQKQVAGKERRIAAVKEARGQYRKHMDVQRKLDEADERRFLGGWDLSI